MTATATKPTNGAVQQQPAAGASKENQWTKEVSFTPFGTDEKISLNATLVFNYLARPTRNGAKPAYEDIVRFLMLCKARRLNPFVGDAFLVGYDGKDGPEFNLITSHQAFLKRAECHKEFDGMDSGVIVADDSGVIHDLVGDFFPDGLILLGAWATVFFKGRSHPMKKRVKLATFNKGYSRWKIDPAGMIVKCAEADALRSSFPTEIGGLYTEDEMGQDIPVRQVQSAQHQISEAPATLAGRIRGARQAAPLTLPADDEAAADGNGEELAEPEVATDEPMTESQEASINHESQRTGINDAALNACIKEVGGERLQKLTRPQAAALIRLLGTRVDKK